MRETSNCYGFSLIEAVLITILFGLVSFSGWYVLHAKDNAGKALSTASAGNTSSTPLSSEWVPYHNAAYGFTLNYPKPWGSPTVSRTSGITGYSYSLVW